jgi:hypothetical protein
VYSRAVEGELADPRADAVGADEQVVAPARAVRQLDLGPVERLHRRAEAHPRAGLLRGAQQDRVQRPPQDPDRAGVLGPGEPREVRGRTQRARRVVVLEAGHPEPRPDHGVEEAERLQRAQRRRLQDDARARDRPLRLVVDDVHLDAPPAERAGERQTADAAADDQDAVHAGEPT